jgi:hypothetical protein
VINILQNDSDIKPIIVENNSSNCFDNFRSKWGCDILYTNNNKNRYYNKGVNELMDIKEVINKYNINDEDVVIKLTGRYKILSDDFFNCVKTNMDNYDAFVKCFNVCTLKFHKDDCALGMIGVKCKYLKDFEYNCIKSPECEIIDHIREKVDSDRIKEVTNLNIECCFADDLRILCI